VRETFLVTGGAGFIGSHLVDALTASGRRVVVLDDFSTGRIENLEQAMKSGMVEVVEGSTCDSELVDRAIAEADACFHLASAVGVELIVEQTLDSLIQNVRGSENVLVAAADHGTRLLFASTSEIYGKDSEGALSEESDRHLGPLQKSRWSYAVSKGFGESLAYALHHERGAEMLVARIFNTVGPRQSGNYGMVLPRFVRQALDGEDLTVHGRGVQSRCFVHVLDTVDALLRLIDRDAALGAAWNVGSDQEVEIIELARRVIASADSPSGVRLVPFDDAYGEGFEELGRRRPDASALRELTGWVPTLTLDDAIADVISFERERGVPSAAMNGHSERSAAQVAERSAAQAAFPAAAPTSAGRSPDDG
jgi:UDP-glucose 4-epimerase